MTSSPRTPGKALETNQIRISGGDRVELRALLLRHYPDPAIRCILISYEQRTRNLAVGANVNPIWPR